MERLPLWGTNCLGFSDLARNWGEPGSKNTNPEVHRRLLIKTEECGNTVVVLLEFRTILLSHPTCYWHKAFLCARLKQSTSNALSTVQVNKCLYTWILHSVHTRLYVLWHEAMRNSLECKLLYFLSLQKYVEFHLQLVFEIHMFIACIVAVGSLAWLWVFTVLFSKKLCNTVMQLGWRDTSLCEPMIHKLWNSSTGAYTHNLPHLLSTFLATSTPHLPP